MENCLHMKLISSLWDGEERKQRKQTTMNGRKTTVYGCFYGAATASNTDVVSIEISFQNGS